MKKSCQYLKKGYMYVKAPDHHLADCNGYVKRSKLVMEKKLGRPLLPTEIVHHCDGDKLNDAMENLIVFPSTRKHFAYHKLVPELSNRQRIILSFVRDMGPLTINDIFALTRFTIVEIKNDLQRMKRASAIKKAKDKRWQASQKWAARIIVTSDGVLY